METVQKWLDETGSEMKVIFNVIRIWIYPSIENCFSRGHAPYLSAPTIKEGYGASNLAVCLFDIRAFQI